MQSRENRGIYLYDKWNTIKHFSRLVKDAEESAYLDGLGKCDDRVFRSRVNR